jgi:hypothetical protein
VCYNTIINKNKKGLKMKTIALEIDDIKKTLTLKEEFQLPLYENNKEIDLHKYTIDGLSLYDHLEEDGYLFEDEYIFKEEDLKTIASINTYYSGTDMIDSSTNFYNLGEDLYVVNPADSNEYYVWDDFEDMIKENISAVEAWHQGDEELKKAYFGDELEEIDTIVVDEDNGDCFILTNSISLEEDNPAYSFEMVGITEDRELVYYSINNCNVTIADRPSGYVFTLEEMFKRLEDGKDTLSDGAGYNDNKGLPYKSQDVKDIVEFWLEHNK